MNKAGIVGPLCPKCGQPGKCFHDGDVGAGNTYYDQYRFECGHCGFTDQQTLYGGDSGWDSWFTNCPYCGRRGSESPIVTPQPDSTKGSDRQPTVIKPLCPKCGQAGQCFHDGVVGGPCPSVPCEQYRFECGNHVCGFKDMQTIGINTAAITDDFTTCPYCSCTKPGDQPQENWVHATVRLIQKLIVEHWPGDEGIRNMVFCLCSPEIIKSLPEAEVAKKIKGLNFLHRQSQPWDDDEHWIVQSPFDSRWYHFCTMSGGGWPKLPTNIYDARPAWFDNNGLPS